MMDDQVWLEAVRRVTANPRNSGVPEAEIRRLMGRVSGGQIMGGASRRVAVNPQLQVLGDMRRNPGRRNDQSEASRPIEGALQKFHGKSDGDIVTEFEVDDGSDDEIQLAYLGHVPAISWLAEPTAKKNKGRKSRNDTLGDHEIDVDGELVKFFGNRALFRGKSQPILALRIPTNEAVIVQGSVDSLRDQCDADGIFGYSPVVEYIVEALRGSSKGDSHYVHEFEKDLEPVLRWDDSVNGLVFDRNRSLIPGKRNSGKRAIYEVTDWFHEKGIREHGDPR